MRRSDVRSASSTAIPPRGPIDRPALRAKEVSGRTPMARTTRSAGRKRPSVSSTARRQHLAQACAQHQLHPVAGQLVVHDSGELGVQRGEHLVSQLDQGDLEASAPQVLGHLDPDEASPYHDRALGAPVVDGSEDRFDVPDRPQSERTFDTWQVRHDRGRARGKDQPVPCKLVALPGRALDDRDRLVRAVDLQHLGVDSDVQRETGVKPRPGSATATPPGPR